MARRRHTRGAARLGEPVGGVRAARACERAWAHPFSISVPQWPAWTRRRWPGHGEGATEAETGETAAAMTDVLVHLEPTAVDKLVRPGPPPGRRTLKVRRRVAPPEGQAADGAAPPAQQAEAPVTQPDGGSADGGVDGLAVADAVLVGGEVNASNVLGDVAAFQAELERRSAPAQTSTPVASPSPTRDTQQRSRAAFSPTAEVAAEAQALGNIEPAAAEALLDAFSRRSEARFQAGEVAVRLREARAQAFGADADASVRTTDLNSTISARVIAGAEERALDHFDRQEAEWSAVQQALAKEFNKEPSELVMERHQDFRERREENDMLHLAVPAERRRGSDQWAMSLRDNWTRFVPVGNIFSGLFCPVPERPQAEEVELVRRPLAAKPKVPRSEVKTHWSNDATFKAKKKQYARQISELVGHLPDHDDARGLQVTGVSVEAALSAMGESVVTLAECEAELEQYHPSGWEAVCKARAALAEQAQARAAAAAIAAQAEATALRLRGLVEGPAAELDTPRVCVACGAHESSRATFELANAGTTVLYFAWDELEPVAVPGVTRSRAVSSLAFASGQGGAGSALTLNADEGSLLPGERRTFTVAFRPDGHAGCFSRRWALRTHPPLPTVAKGGAAMTVHARGISRARDTSVLERAEVCAHLDAAERKAAVGEALDAIISAVGVRASSSVQQEVERNDGESADERAFLASNAGVRPQFYYTPSLHADCAALVEDCAAAARAASAAALDNAEGTEGAIAAEGEPSEDDEVGVSTGGAWNSSMASLEGAITEAESCGVAADALGTLQARLGALRSRTVVPPHRRAVRLVAMYEALCGVAEAIAAAGEGARAEAEVMEKKGEGPEPGAEGAEGVEAAEGDEGAEGAESDSERAAAIDAERYDALLSERAREAVGAGATAFESLFDELVGSLAGELDRRVGIARAAGGASGAWDEFALHRAKETLCPEHVAYLGKARTPIAPVPEAPADEVAAEAAAIIREAEEAVAYDAALTATVDAVYDTALAGAIAEAFGPSTASAAVEVAAEDTA